jgi:hypothetical protein
MIGVIARPEEHAAVEEFFELFKTPWELFREGQGYDVVIAAADNLPVVDATLLLIFRAATTSVDSLFAITPGAKLRNVRLKHAAGELPIEGEVLTFRNCPAAGACLTVNSAAAGLKICANDQTVLRMGYDLFGEVQRLLSIGQSLDNVGTATLELHINLLRDWILAAGVSLMEIPPVPAGYDFTVCLTHDIDFIGIRQHKFDHTMFGFLYRSTFGAVTRFMRRRISFSKVLRSWKAAASLPFVYIGWLKDFWIPFDWYLKVEKNLPATYFLIPFKKRAGQKVSSAHAERRACAYDVDDIADWNKQLVKEGCEIGVHGIDAWHSVKQGREELGRVAAWRESSRIGVRMHWLLQDQNTYGVLDEAGYSYDSTAGYNETVGYRCGTTQAFRPLGMKRLMELPMHIQDGALFYPQKMDLTESQAWEACEAVVESTRKFGGVLTVLWHDRSHAPERFWGDFYERFVGKLRTEQAWFATASDAVEWFKKRRAVRFERAESADAPQQVKARYTGSPINPGLIVRLHDPSGSPGRRTDVVWDGRTELDRGRLQRPSSPRVECAAIEVSTGSLS